MKEGTRFGKFVAISYGILVSLVTALLVYITLSEGVQEQLYRPLTVTHSYSNLQPEMVQDADAPQGVLRRYHLAVEDKAGENNYLCMYVVHSYVDVYVEDKDLYHLKVSERNRFIHSPGSVWVMIPLRNTDAGKTITIDITPVYQGVVNNKETFYIGSRLDIYKERLAKDLPQLIVCFLTIICGLGLALVSFRRYLQGNRDTANGYLGIFAFMMGLWKVTDCRFIPLLFPQDSLALSVISIATLSVSVFPLINYMRKQVRLKRFPILEAASVLTILAGAACLVLQFFGVMEYRESLLVSHAGVFTGIVAVVVAGIRAWILERNNARVRMAVMFLILCVIGAIIDLSIFYIRGSSASIVFMVVAFLCYILYVGISNNKELVQRANRDLFTGLFNKTCCNELLENSAPVKGQAALIMIDLNDLKYTNDTMGHEAGDEMIVSFVGILKAEALQGAFLGRYGGDEFIAYIEGADKKKVSEMISRVEIGTATHNAANRGPDISYSIGVAFSDEFDQQPTVHQLFQKADERMYVEKKKYHELHDRRGKGRRRSDQG